jgi:hypothetical protein
MADSLSFGGALPVAAIAACCESFQLSLLAMTFRWHRAMRASDSPVASLLRRWKRWTKRTHEDTEQTCAVPPDDGTPNQHVVAGPNKSARAQVRRLRVCTWINIVNFRQPDADGHCLSLEEDSVSPGRKRKNRSVEIIRRGQSRRLNLPLLRVFPIVVSCDERAGVIEQVKGRIGQGSRNPKGSQRRPHIASTNQTGLFWSAFANAIVARSRRSQIVFADRSRPDVRA